MTRHLLVDGNNIFSRADFAAKGGRTQMSVDGVNTSTLVIFANLLSKYVKQVNPTHMAIFWDAGHTLRDEIDPRYKAKRVKHVEAPEEAITPWRQAKEFLTWAGVPHLARPGLEADDLIAYSVHCNPGVETVILSGDKDLTQLVSEHVTQIRPGGKGAELWDLERVRSDMGCEPEQIPLLMSMTGDPGDGVQGVPGLGPKKAAALLEKAEGAWDPLLDLLGPEKAADALQARRLVDLVHEEFAVWGNPHSLIGMGPIHVPEFLPAKPGSITWEPLTEFLVKWQLNSIKVRLDDGSMWYQGVSEEPSQTSGDAFSGFQID